jgi:hypothetical protein
MKYRTTRKAIVEGTPRKDLFAVGYCDLTHLLCNHQPIAYTCGVYGWNFDVYTVNGKTICTGYRNMPGFHANNVTEYERRARAIHNDYSRPWEERSAEIEALLDEFLEQA